MVFEAILFLAGAVLFFLSVLFFVFLWQDRTALSRRREALQAEVSGLKEQRVELEIREHELEIWADGLEHQQKALEHAKEELRMLTETHQPPATPEGAGSPRGDTSAPLRRTHNPHGEVPPALKNVKHDPKLD